MRSTHKKNPDVAAAFLQDREKLQAIANSYVQNWTVAEDIVHDAVAKVLEISKNGAISNPRAYLVTAVRNQSVSYLRSYEKKNVDQLDNLVVLNVISDDPLQDCVLEGREKLDSFVDAFKGLSPQCRRAVYLAKVRGLSLKETAETMGLSVSTVQKHLTRALSQCATYMVEHGHE